jgi:hypothetical protein
MFIWTGLTILALGVAVWFLGGRLWLLAAGAGALLGIGLLRLFPALAEGFMGWVVVGGLAVTLGVLGFIFRRFTRIIGWVIGFIAGGGIALGFLDAFGIAPSYVDWILAVVAGVAGALVFVRFFDWGLIILASLIGSLLVVRGLMLWLWPGLAGPIGTLIVLVLTTLGIYYHYRRRAPTAPPAASTGATNP